MRYVCVSVWCVSVIRHACDVHVYARVCACVCDVLDVGRRGTSEFPARAYMQQSPHAGLQPASLKCFSPWHLCLLDVDQHLGEK